MTENSNQSRHNNSPAEDGKQSATQALTGPEQKGSSLSRNEVVYLTAFLSRYFVAGLPRRWAIVTTQPVSYPPLELVMWTVRFVQIPSTSVMIRAVMFSVFCFRNLWCFFFGVHCSSKNRYNSIAVFLRLAEIRLLSGLSRSDIAFINVFLSVSSDSLLIGL